MSLCCGQDKFWIDGDMQYRCDVCSKVIKNFHLDQKPGSR